jgi:hypothetical protein
MTQSLCAFFVEHVTHYNKKGLQHDYKDAAINHCMPPMKKSFRVDARGFGFSQAAKLKMHAHETIAHTQAVTHHTHQKLKSRLSREFFLRPGITTLSVFIFDLVICFGSGESVLSSSSSIVFFVYFFVFLCLPHHEHHS